MSSSYTIVGFTGGAGFAKDVSSAGDVDGDGLGDFLISAPFMDGGGAGSGETYLVYGKNLAEMDAADGKIDHIINFADQPLCFAGGTLIRTAHGDVRVEDLAVGDAVMTLDRGLQPLRWIGAMQVDRGELEEHSNLKPIRIRAGALHESGLPEQDLIVSRQHRVLVRSDIAQRMFGSDEIIVPACKLLSLDGVELLEECESITYYHLLFDQHELILANNAPAESLFTGPEALKAVDSEARLELIALFPEIVDSDWQPSSVRPIEQKGKKIQQLVMRHQKNNKPMVTPFDDGENPENMKEMAHA